MTIMGLWKRKHENVNDEYTRCSFRSARYIPLQTTLVHLNQTKCLSLVKVTNTNTCLNRMIRQMGHAIVHAVTQ